MLKHKYKNSITASKLKMTFIPLILIFLFNIYFVSICVSLEIRTATISQVSAFHNYFAAWILYEVYRLSIDPSQASYVRRKPHYFVLVHLLMLLFATIMVLYLVEAHSVLWWSVLMYSVVFSCWNIPFILIPPDEKIRINV